MTWRGRKSGTVVLGRELARGGEGIIYDVAGHDDLVAKVYHRPPASERVEKIIAMTSSSPVPYCAWPVDELWNESGHLIGFLMKKVSSRYDIHNVFSPSARQKTFPETDYGFLVAVAENLARVVANVHSAGHVIGDINERFAMVSEDATVYLIDCDSFQVTIGSRTFYCDVGTMHYQPPELQDVATLRGLRRSRNHDCFGLAVLIFQILFLGRHPFAGRPKRADISSLEEAIRRYLFAYAPDMQDELDPPPHSLPLSSVTPKIQTYFRIAFGARGRERGRPKAASWAQALADFRRQLRSCQANPLHRHLGSSCPLCAIEQSSGKVLFVPKPFPDQQDWLGRAKSLWREIQHISPPPSWGSRPKPEDFVKALSGRGERIEGNTANGHPVLMGLFFGFLLSVIVGVTFPAHAGASLVIGPLGGLLSYGLAMSKREARLRRMVEDAKREYERLAMDWDETEPVCRFQRLREELHAAYKEIVKLDAECCRTLAELKKRASERALQSFLAQIEITPSVVQGIGATLVATMRSFGVETAADCEMRRLLSIPGIGPKRAKRLVQWRKEKEKEFPGSIRCKLDPRDIQRIKSGYQAKAAVLVKKLEDGVFEMRQMKKRADRRDETLYSQLEAAAKRVALYELQLKQS